MPEFAGIYASAITPRSPHGDIDLGAAFELIDFLSRSKVHGIVFFGDSGEYPSFPVDDRSRLLYLAVKRSRVPVLAGVGSASLDVSVALAREAREAGADAVVVPPPFFFLYDADDLREFYLQFAAHLGSGIPILIANSPETTSPIPASTIAEILHTGHFAGVVDSSGDAESFTCVRVAAEARSLDVLAGNDPILPRTLNIANGAVSAAACAVPELVLALESAIRNADRATVDRLSGLLEEFLAWTAQFPQPVAVKVAAALRGIKIGPLPVPLSAAKENLLGNFREWFRTWLPAVQRLAAHA